jgi:hypothetical protein
MTERGRCCWTYNKPRYRNGRDQFPADSLGHYKGQGGNWKLDSWTSNTYFQTAPIGMIFSRTTAPPTDQNYNHTQKDLSLFLLQQLVQEFFITPCSSGLNAPSDPICSFIDRRNHRFACIIKATHNSNAHSLPH